MNDAWWDDLSRATGIVATILAVAALVMGLFFSARNTGERRRPAWWLDLHNWLGGLTLVFVAAHIVAAYLDPALGIGVLQVLVPGTAQDSTVGDHVGCHRHVRAGDHRLHDVAAATVLATGVAPRAPHVGRRGDPGRAARVPVRHRRHDPGVRSRPRRRRGRWRLRRRRASARPRRRVTAAEIHSWLQRRAHGAPTWSGWDAGRDRTTGHRTRRRGASDQLERLRRLQGRRARPDQASEPVRRVIGEPFALHGGDAAPVQRTKRHHAARGARAGALAISCVTTVGLATLFARLDAHSANSALAALPPTIAVAPSTTSGGDADLRTGDVGRPRHRRRPQRRRRPPWRPSPRPRP